MTFSDTVNYVFFSNPVVKTTTDYVKYFSSATISTITGGSKPPPVPKPVMCDLPIWKHTYGGSSFVRLAGLCGAAAVALGAYGAHTVYPKGQNEDLKRIFETANRYHFLHTLALFGVPLSRWPKTSGTLMVTGMLLFCGTCYYHALTGKDELRRLTPIGGSLLIAGWLAMVL